MTNKDWKDVAMLAGGVCGVVFALTLAVWTLAHFTDVTIAFIAGSIFALAVIVASVAWLMLYSPYSARQRRC